MNLAPFCLWTSKEGNCNVLICINYVNVFNKPFLTALGLSLAGEYSEFCFMFVTTLYIQLWVWGKNSTKGSLDLEIIKWFVLGGTLKLIPTPVVGKG